jgi:hypothetical protein
VPHTHQGDSVRLRPLYALLHGTRPDQLPDPTVSIDDGQCSILMQDPDVWSRIEAPRLQALEDMAQAARGEGIEPLRIPERRFNPHAGNEAGIRVWHIHAREDDGAPTYSSSRYRAIADGIRAECPILLNFSTGAIGLPIEERVAHGADVILEIDLQGAINIKRNFSNAVLIFILPPSWEELRSRLERRGEDTPEVIELRLKNAAIEMAQTHEFDFVIINELFERAVFDMKTIVHAQRLKFAAQRRARAETFQALRIA